MEEEYQIQSFQNIEQLQSIIPDINKYLSEPYNDYTYQYFIKSSPDLCLFLYYKQQIIGGIIGNAKIHKDVLRAYIAMIVVNTEFQRKGLGAKILNEFIKRCKEKNVQEIVLETEEVNKGALNLYKQCGFIRTKKFQQYYQTGNDAFRLKLVL